MSELTSRHCVPCEGGVAPLELDEARKMLGELNEWTLDGSGKEIARTFTFKNYYQTMAFVNALAWIAHREDHHPDLEVGYNRVHVRFSTHAIGGLSENDFICAAKIDALSG
ncbi:MAG: 4a-hydroxytetrahydrobiopterin dehydratase [Gammaproteobacteria bacterium]|nr:4a-hydroxytetrahydrobiopterin dehydratase [Gammaproteobacteria bacterium]NIM71765.1 4a-hydroxytetrahydrobiopterin dehydratase [Gammaproteobacteria bacterium]NIN37861.1 4a-hydroxytetrahydrobiopterin dehydratase [Gammaproteobacteria bacterium]NIO23521.1 4a-hydroxytetrahydrobiopterin dehydratase [Gammaproteobacteria bacterium]NIO64137.1 4a-hydroxytetrahydrobiopterin dehydratase [Gammaproteobacteria bacterium]